MWLLVVPILHALASFLFPFVYWPEMLNWPFVMARGFLPYVDFSIVHTPFLPLTLTLLNGFFGETPRTLHFFGTSLLVITNLLIGYLVYKKTGLKRAIFAQALYVFISLAFEGNSVWFDLMLAPLVLTVYVLITSETSPKKLFILGLVFGLMFTIKQTSVYLLPAIFLITKFNFKKISCFAIGYLFILFIFFSLLYCFGLLPAFSNWAVKFVFLLPFIKDTSGTLTPDFVLPTIKQTLVLATFFLAVLVNLDKKNLRATCYMLLALLFAFPRFSYFHLMPFVAIFLVYVCQRKIWPLVFVFIAVTPVFIKAYQTGNRFLTPSVYAVSEEIKTNYPNATIFSLNGPYLVYYLTGKTPAVKPWIDQLSWHLAYADAEFTNAFLKNLPDLIVHKPYLDVPHENLGAYRPQKVYNFVMANYSLVKSFPDGTILLKRTAL